MRQCGSETAPRFFKCRRLECAFARERQITNQSAGISERSRLDEMVRNLAGGFVDGTGRELLDFLGDSRVQVLSTRRRNACKQSLAHEFVGESERPLGSLGARDNYSHLLGLLDDGEKFVNVSLADAGQELKAETASDHCGGSQHLLFFLVEPLQTAPDDQPHIFRNIALVDLEISAKLSGRIEDFSLFDQMPVHLLDEERISLTFLEDGVHQFFRSEKLARTFQHLPDGILGPATQLQGPDAQPNQLLHTSG